MSAVMVSDAVSNGIVCSFRRFPHSQDGYYEIRTEQGEFLSNEIGRASCRERV